MSTPENDLNNVTAVEDYRNPRREAFIVASDVAIASWSAPVTWRFRTMHALPFFAAIENRKSKLKNP
jgi:hypothetical protein